MLAQLTLVILLVTSSLGGPISKFEVAEPRVDISPYRLPTNVKPLKYSIELKPDLIKDTFEGSVTIDVNIIENTDSITLHIKNLTMPPIKDIKVVDNEQKEFTVKSAKETKEYEFYNITFDNNLVKGKNYTLTIPGFTGILHSDQYGFYIAKYTDKTGATKKFATTQFEPTHARRAFPCFDEPALKANFKISLTRPSGQDIITASNAAVEKSEGLKDIYKETELMSTYLVAFIVGELKFSEKKGEPSLEHRILGKPKDIEDKKHTYALEIGTKVLKQLEDFLGVKYTFGKMDQAAIPDDYYASGAMENWGLVTYKEMYLMYSPGITTTSTHQRIPSIIAHEFGHQWFGNLVSPLWWEYVWLNEGFASYFEHFSADKVEPSWEIMDQFVIKVLQYGFHPDSLETTRPMNHNGNTPKEISGLFDRVAYEKSGSVIRMMEHFLTSDVFRNGLTKYLTKMNHKAAVPQDLYSSLQDALSASTTNHLPKGIDLSTIMSSWDSVKGYPVVTVTRNYETEKDKIKLEQKKFLLREKSSEDGKWIIPINFATKSKPNYEITTPDTWLSDKSATITVTELKADDWLIANKKQTGYYRVNYDEKNWDLLSKSLIENHTKIDKLNRAQLIDDSFNLARSQRLSYAIPLQLGLYLEKEVEYIPFYSFFNVWTYLNDMISASSAYSSFKTYGINVILGAYKHLGFDEKKDDKHTDKLNRVNVLDWLCRMGHSECRAKSSEKVTAWIADPSKSISPDLQLTVFCGAMQQATKEEFEKLYNVFSAEKNAQLQSRILNGLGCSENTAILEGFLSKSMTTNSVPIHKVINAVYKGGPIGLKTAFDFVTKNFVDLLAKMTEKDFKSIISGIGKKLSTQEQLKQLEDLSNLHTDRSEMFATAISEAKVNVKFVDSSYETLNSWFSKYSTGGAISNMYSSIFVIAISLVLCLITV